MRLRVGRILGTAGILWGATAFCWLASDPLPPAAVVRTGLPCDAGTVLDGAGALFSANSRLAPDAFIEAARCGTITAPDDDRVAVYRAGKAALARAKERAAAGDVTVATLDTLDVVTIGHDLTSAGNVLDLAVGSTLRNLAIDQLVVLSADPAMTHGTARTVGAVLGRVAGEHVDYDAVLAREERSWSIMDLGWRGVPWRLAGWPLDWWDWRVAARQAAEERRTSSERLVPSMVADAARLEAADRERMRALITTLGH